MLSRRENLLLRPWQQRKYENHRRKVQSAAPVVDNKPPTQRRHVELKLKQLQKEKERIHKIENDNLLLLRKLSHIMKTNRVDNNWTIPQPNFLNRVHMYASKTKLKSLDEDQLFPEYQPVTSKRKSKCTACTPQKQPPIKIPEERIPWEPVKLPPSKPRSKSVPIRKTQTLPTIEEKDTTKKSSASSSARKPPKNLHFPLAQSITINRGALKLAVNFPADAFVKFCSGKKEKSLMGALCHCKKGFAAVACQ